MLCIVRCVMFVIKTLFLVICFMGGWIRMARNERKEGVKSRMNEILLNNEKEANRIVARVMQIVRG